MNDENFPVQYPPEWTKARIEKFEEGVRDLGRKNPGLTRTVDQEGKIRASVERFVGALEQLKNCDVTK